jgi:hypothetical protein
MIRAAPSLIVLTILAATACESPLHRPALSPEPPAKLDLALEPALDIAPCNGPEPVEAHPGATVNLCVRVSTVEKTGKGKNAKTINKPKAGEAVVFHATEEGFLHVDESGVVMTDKAGEARVIYTAGSTLGQQTLLATTAAGAQAEVDVMITEIAPPLATVGQPHPDTQYPVARDILGNLSERVFGKPVSGVR